MSRLPGELPRVSPYAVALPALHWKVTLEELNVDPGGGLSITAGPVGGGVGVGVGVGVTLIGLEVTVEDRKAENAGNYQKPIAIRRVNDLNDTSMLECEEEPR